jgi:hypothetical protein
MVAKVQIAISDPDWARQLREVLLQLGNLDVECTSQPDFSTPGVIVASPERLPSALTEARGPERVVVLAPKNHLGLPGLWNAGVRSVVYDDEPVSMVVLAVSAAQLSAKPQLGRGREWHRLAITA